MTSDDRRLGGDGERAAGVGDLKSSVNALPPTARAMLAPQEDPARAEAAARELAHSHYENFSVVSLLLPKQQDGPTTRYLQRRQACIDTVWAVPRSLATTSGISDLISFPEGTEMFQFPSFATPGL